MGNRRECGFEARESVAKQGYWEDPRWKDVKRLRAEGKHAEANSLTFQIRGSWGID